MEYLKQLSVVNLLAYRQFIIYFKKDIENCLEFGYKADDPQILHIQQLNRLIDYLDMELQNRTNALLDLMPK